MSTAHNNIKFDIDDEWLGTLMLAGFPEAYKPMIMGLESFDIKISADSIKYKLLQEVQCSDNSAFFTRKKAIQRNQHNSTKVKQVLHIPKLAANLLSVNAMVKNGCNVNFRDEDCDIYDKNNKLLCSAQLVNNLYLLNTHRELAKQFWAEALATAAYIINRSPTKSINGKTPMEIWTDTNQIMKSRDVVLLENVEKYNNNINLPCTSNSNNPEIQPFEETCKEELEDSIDHFTGESSEDYQSGENDDSSYIPEQSIDLESPIRNINLRPRRDVEYAETDDHDVSYFCPVLNLNDPQTADEALSSSHADQWKKAMQEEYDSLIKNKTWSLVDAP
ncbi:Retrovirus-related Pol polyprotein from transposon TNT 1-94 [Eumeta japonica]|uniref:Retrovirus-related Pol polyprotein from transposon TNT 1-94 n=1 Tax=Eumeta variegata TaxID=151549 RepID=A0A4C1V424_EUMVA|nr:Retrovirus-related Pol polyprotein from transposon TNT 1-94 [Eumeta japonica]